MILEVRKLRKGDEPSMVVHCSAGIGRTGTIILIDQGIYYRPDARADTASTVGCSGRKTHTLDLVAIDAIENDSPVDLCVMIDHNRQDRMCLVQHTSQYKFAHQAVLLYAERYNKERKKKGIYALVKEGDETALASMAKER
jgi:protein tyrosine phosphatase